jgi:ABC-type branched-subunit amino acid transport system ATPase component
MGPVPLLEVRQLNVAYGADSVLDGVSLPLPAGGVAAVVGGGRTGKTTLLRAISGLLSLHGGRVTGGTVELAGERLAGLEAAAVVARGVAHVLQGRRVFADLTVEENLRAGAFTLRKRAAISAGVERVLDLFPLLAARRSVAAGYLSGGEQQLLAIGRAVVAEPRLLLLDEPSLGLAPVAVEQVARVVTDIAAAGTAVVVAEGPAGGLGLPAGGTTLVLDAARSHRLTA